MKKSFSKNPPVLKTILCIAILISVCTVLTFTITNWLMGVKKWQHDEPSGHQWLKQELSLNEEETVGINAFEAKYHKERAQLQKEFQEKIDVLAQLIRQGDAYSDEVNHAIHQLHDVHGRLQKLSIEHYYEMLSVLPPDKQEKLRNLAVEALSQPE